MSVPDCAISGCSEPRYVSGVWTWISRNHIRRVSSVQQEWSRAPNGSGPMGDSKHWGIPSTSVSLPLQGIIWHLLA